ncbi:double-strand break repair protein AddB [Sphingomonas yunnanensis]|uniref:double-strand break repair protein AddB n=1 Tax=Sphingomonas yunnanensis TaxID=310400 RepID=UPI001CA65011|nr:double-strand break repair protein AddB [Sphingomonas yunnanensis]MBY9061493.1 double-strand break repair protein AddB [Sphingomonas yunnanensis]
MSEAPGRQRGLRLYSIPAHRAFADALVAGLLRRYGADRMALARGLVLVPNNRAALAITDAFVRASGGALLLPRIVALGGDDLEAAIGAALDPADAVPPLPPAIDPLERRMILARLVSEERAGSGRAVDAAEAVRLAGDLARTLDQLIVEEVPPERLAAIDPGEGLSDHWEASLRLFRLLLDRWPQERERLGRVDAAWRRVQLLDRQAARWRDEPPPRFVCAAGITDPAPAVARLLRVVAGLPEGSVVFADLDLHLPEEEWEALGPHRPDPVTGLRRRAIEVHPQFHLKLLLERIGAARGEVTRWGAASEQDAGAARGRAIANALAPAAFTGKWTRLDAADRRLAGVEAVELATPAEEAQAIALKLREAVEMPGRTAALVTPDRALARRVAAHCRRWNIEVDDSAGRPLTILPPGTLLAAIVEAAAHDFAPTALLTLLKHPLVRAGAERGAWLDGVRRLDRALRGPRPGPGLDGIDRHLAGGNERERAVRSRAAEWWHEARLLLDPAARVFGDGETTLAALVAGLREAAQRLAGDEAWRGVAGRAAADLLAALEEQAPRGPAQVTPASFATMLRQLMDESAVRLLPRERHARLAIYGLIEARLQSADLMILSGLSEGVWPGLPAPDPWLAPRIRAELGLPGLERGIGTAAHDFAQALGAPRVLLTRARRDQRSPALASRFWLRLEAMTGERFPRMTALADWARALDHGGVPRPAARPAPLPPAALRPRAISVTEVDRLKADPYAFYARRILKLLPLDPVDADPSAAWRGTAVHAVLEAWARDDRCDPAALLPRARLLLQDPAAHPLLRALWQPRLVAAFEWIAARTLADRAEGREVLAVEGRGRAELSGIALDGRFDRIDRMPDGGLGIVDYKTGKAPSVAAVRGGFNLQLGLLGALAEQGGFDGVRGDATAFEYWSLAKKGDGFGSVSSPADPAGKGGRIPTGDFVAAACASFAEAAARWLTGEEAFTAKLHPEFAPYAEYDQLMRRDEWYGREQARG